MSKIPGSDPIALAQALVKQAEIAADPAHLLAAPLLAAALPGIGPNIAAVPGT